MQPVQVRTISEVFQHCARKTFIVFAEGSEGILEVNFQVHLSTFLSHYLSIDISYYQF